MSNPRWTTKPVIVAGINRSGTKWLSNEIAAHPEIACVQADVHGGIVESNLLTEYGRGFDLASDSDYEEFLQFWQRTHFFHLAQGDTNWLRSLEPRPSNSVEALRFLMEAYATGLSKKFWVQKVSPRDAAATLDALPDARVVVIRRAAVDTVRSKVRLDSKRGVKTNPLRGGMSQGIQSRKLDRILQREDVLLVRYESLLAERAETMNEVFRFIGLGPVEASSDFRPNTSFANTSDRKETLGKYGETVVRMASGLCQVLPLTFLESMQKVFARERAEIIPGTFVHEED
jgi:hypothetical protein